MVVMALPVDAAEEATVIGLSVSGANAFYDEALINGAETAADEMGITLVVMTAENDIEQELENVRALIEEGAQAILLHPVDAVESAGAVEAATEAEIPVFLLGTALAGDAAPESAAVIRADDAVSGELAGKSICGALSEEGGTVIEIVGTFVVPELEEEDEGSEDVEATDEEAAPSPLEVRSENFKAHLAENCPDVAVTAFEVAQVDRDAFVDAFVAFLGDVEGVDAVVAYNPELTMAAAEAATMARVRGLVFVGYGATEDTTAALQNNEWLHSLITPTAWLMAEEALNTAVAYLAGEEMPEDDVLVESTVLDNESVAMFKFCFGGCNRRNR
jgi:ribose transport system substrate-binding protein